MLREKAVAAQRELQERKQRLQALGAAPAAVSATAQSSAPAAAAAPGQGLPSEWERSRAERERREGRALLVQF